MATKFEKRLPKNYSSCRELRNLAEKQRRDKLNHYVNELSTLVPFVAEHKSQKRVDKISVLRLAASYIRLHKIIDKDNEYFSTKRLSTFKMNASQSLLKAIGGFLLVVSSAGKVIYASEAVEEAFGYTQTDILGQTFFQFIHDDDKKLFKHQLTAQESPRRSFYCRMLEKNARNEPARYEIIHVVGTMKEIFQDESNPPSVTTQVESHHGLRPRKRSRSATNTVEMDDGEGYTGEEYDGTSNRSQDNRMLVSFVKIVRDRPITEVSWIESNRDEYITRHSIDGTIAHVDHRISFVTGMMPQEVIGKMAYGYIHEDDVMWSLLSNRKMFMSPEGQGAATVRLASRDGKYVTLRCRGFVEINKSTGEIDSFVCINTVLSKKDAEKEMIRERTELLAILQNQSPSELIKEIITQLPPALLSLLKNILTPKVIEKMLRNATNINLNDETSLTMLANDLPKKFVSLNGDSKLPAEELQFPVSSSKHLQETSQPKEDWFTPPVKRPKNCRQQCADLAFDSSEGLLTSSADRNHSEYSLDSHVSNPGQKVPLFCPLSPVDICHNAVIQDTIYSQENFNDVSRIAQINDSVMVAAGNDVIMNSNVLHCMPPLSDNDCSFLESSCKDYISNTTFPSDSAYLSTYNS